MNEGHRRTGLTLGIALLVATSAPAWAGTAKGTIDYKGTKATITHAYLVKGPDAVDETKKIRRVVFTAADFDAKLSACKAMHCSESELGEGMTIDLDGGPRVNYWVVLKGQMVQYSGTAQPATLKSSTDEPLRSCRRKSGATEQWTCLPSLRVSTIPA